MELKRKYGTQTTIYLPLVDFGFDDFESTPVTFAAGDVQISKDGGAFANVTNSVAHEGNGIYSLVLTATEMEFAFGQITFIDQTATKLWIDTAVLIQTFGHASADIEHNFDLDYLQVDITEIAGQTATTNATTNLLDVDVKAISGDTSAADKQEAALDALLTGTAITGTLTSTEFTTDLTLANDTVLVDRIGIWRPGAALEYEMFEITAYNGTTKKITCNTMTGAPVNTDAFVIL